MEIKPKKQIPYEIVGFCIIIISVIIITILIGVTIAHFVLKYW